MQEAQENECTPLRTFQGELTEIDLKEVVSYRIGWPQSRERGLELHSSGIGGTTIYCPDCMSMMAMGGDDLRHRDGCSNHDA